MYKKRYFCIKSGSNPTYYSYRHLCLLYYNHTNTSLFNDSIPYNRNIFAKQFFDKQKTCNISVASDSYFVPVEPNPPTPLSVFVSSSVSQNSAFKNGAITSCAILSPSETVCSIKLWLCNATITSPL